VGNRRNGKGKGTGAFKKPQTLEPEQAATAQADGEVDLLRLFGLVGKMASKPGRSGYVAYSSAAQVLGTDVGQTREALDKMVAMGAVEKRNGGGYVPTSKFGKVYSSYAGAQG
jgi:hypothetical protein